MNNKYSAAEKKYIRDHADNWKDEKLVQWFNKRFNRNLTLDAFRKLRLRLGIEKASGRGHIKVLKYDGPPIPKKPRTYRKKTMEEKIEEERKKKEQEHEEFLKAFDQEIPRKDMTPEDIMALRWRLKAKNALRQPIHLK